MPNRAGVVVSAVRLAAVATAVASVLATAPAPAHADAVGAPCRLASADDEPSVYPYIQYDDPYMQTGVMTAGPWTATTGASRVSIACWVQIDDWTYRWPWTWPLTSTTDGSAGFLVGVYTYDVLPGQTPFLCTRVDWTDGAGYHALYVDEYPTVPGNQCRALTAIDRARVG